MVCWSVNVRKPTSLNLDKMLPRVIMQKAHIHIFTYNCYCYCQIVILAVAVTVVTAVYYDGYGGNGGGEASSYASYTGYTGGGGGGSYGAAPQVQTNYYAAPVRKEEPVYDYYVSMLKEQKKFEFSFILTKMSLYINQYFFIMLLTIN